MSEVGPEVERPEPVATSLKKTSGDSRETSTERLEAALDRAVAEVDENALYSLNLVSQIVKRFNTSQSLAENSDVLSEIISRDSGEEIRLDGAIHGPFQPRDGDIFDEKTGTYKRTDSMGLPHTIGPNNYIRIRLGKEGDSMVRSPEEFVFDVKPSADRKRFEVFGVSYTGETGERVYVQLRTEERNIGGFLVDIHNYPEELQRTPSPYDRARNNLTEGTNKHKDLISEATQIETMDMTAMKAAMDRLNGVLLSKTIDEGIEN